MQACFNLVTSASLQFQADHHFGKKDFGMQFPIRLVIVLVALIDFSVLAGPRTFKNSAGKEIIAEAVSHDGNGSFQLKRSDGNLFQVKSSDLSPDDQRYLQEWAKANPPKIDYRFDIKIAPKKVSGSRSSVGGYKDVKNELWTYEVNITNLSRQTVNGLSTEFRVFMIDAADGQFSSGNITEGFVSGTAAISKELRFNETFEFNTGEVKIDKVSYDWSFSRDERYKDALRGLMIRIKDSAGKVVHEFVSSNVSLKGKTWDSIPATREIKQRD